MSSPTAVETSRSNGSHSGSDGGGSHGLKRNYMACLNCRLRKTKCDLGDSMNPHDPPCARCRRERKECVFATKKPRGRKASQPPPLLPVADSKFPVHKTFPSNTPETGSSRLEEPERLWTDSPDQTPSPTATSAWEHTGSSGKTMMYLAHVAGDIGKADVRDRIDAREKFKSLGHTINQNKKLKIDDSTRPVMQTSPPKNDSADHLKPESYLLSMRSRYKMPPLNSMDSVRPEPTTSLTEIEYIGDNSILSEREARRLIALFFSTMHPFFPFIPEYMHSADILAGYPMLLCVILTISARYNSFEYDVDPTKPEDTKYPRNIEVHERLWVYCQRLISQTVWAEASTRSIGTVFAFLLFTEWNPRAIHWRWNDYANMTEDDLGPPDGSGLPDGDSTNMAGLGAMRRSDRMAWMLIGSAVRLAQDMAFIEHDPNVFLATHISETFTAMNITRRSMLSQSLSEVDLGDPAEGSSLKFTEMQKARIELLQFTSLVYESLYGSKPKLGGLPKTQNLALLDLMTPLLESWYRRYHKLLVPSSSAKITAKHEQKIIDIGSKYCKSLAEMVDAESLIFDYYYAKLYVYSLALSNERPVGETRNYKKHLRIDALSTSRYIEMAYNAAKETLAVGHRVNKLRLLKCMPIRWLIRIVKAVAFIVKCYLTLTSTDQSRDGPWLHDSSLLSLSTIPVEEIVSILQSTAIVLREAAPDELHLCTRYSTVLMYLCSQFKSNSQNNHKTAPPRDYEREINEQEQAYRATEESASSQDEGQAPQPSTAQTSFEQDQFNMFSLDQMTMDPSETVFNFFTQNENNGNYPGLEFVDTWTEQLEQEFLQKSGMQYQKGM